MKIVEPSDIEDTFKWGWMMSYCRRSGIPPARSWAWKEAEKAWKERRRQYDGSEHVEVRE